MRFLPALVVLIFLFSCSDKKKAAPPSESGEAVTAETVTEPGAEKPEAEVAKGETTPGDETKPEKSICPDGKSPVPVIAGKSYIVDTSMDKLDLVRCMSWEDGDRKAVFTLVDKGDEESGDVNAMLEGITKKMASYSYDTGVGGHLVWQISEGDLVFISEESGSGSNYGSTKALRIYWGEGKKILVQEWTNFGDFTKKAPAWAEWGHPKDE